MSVLIKGNAEEKIRFGFSLLDVDKDGLITREEMAKTVQSLYSVLSELFKVSTLLMCFPHL